MPRRILFIIITASIALAGASAGNQKNIIEWHRQAKNLLAANPDSAIVLLNRALTLGQYAETDSLTARSEYYLGIAHYYRGQYYLSSYYYQKALKSLYAERNINFRSKCLNNLGVNQEITGSYDDAIKSYLKSMDIDARLGDSTGVAQTQINIGLLHLELGQTGQARILLTKALNFFRKTENSNGMALAYHNLGKLSFDLQQPDSALFYLTRAGELYKKAANHYEYVNIRIFMASVEMNRGHYDKASRYLYEAARFAESAGYNAQWTAANILRAKLMMRKGQYAAAREIIKNIHPINEKNKRNKRIVQLKLMAGETSPARFSEELDRFISYQDSLHKAVNDGFISQLQIRYETEKKIQTIQNQNRMIRSQKMKIIYLAAGSGLLVLLLIVIALLYLRLRKSYRKLYQNSEKLRKCTSDVTRRSKPIISGESRVEGNDGLWKMIVNVLQHEKRFTDPELTIEKLALACNSNKTYVSREIKKHTDMNFSNFINRLRIREVINRLPDSRMSLEAIAGECGFNSSSTFYRSFKAETGLTPRQYIQLAAREKKSGKHNMREEHPAPDPS